MARNDRQNRLEQYQEEVQTPEETRTLTEQEREDLKNSSELLSLLIEENFKDRIQNRSDYMVNTHMRTSFLFRKDLKDRLDALSEKKDRGFRTQFLNDAIEHALRGFEDTEGEG